jgi:hypothetical protein
MTKPTDDYKVGYGKPPRHTQFKKGQSGHPSGRPKGSKIRLADIYEKYGRKKVKMTIDGRAERVSMLEAIVVQQFAMAQKSPRALADLLKIYTQLHHSPLPSLEQLERMMEDFENSMSLDDIRKARRMVLDADNNDVDHHSGDDDEEI